MQIKRVTVGASVAVLAALATACGEGGDGGASVTRAAFEDDGLDWPFSVEEGSLHCDDGAVFFRARSGEQYAVNEAAVESDSYAAPDPIWLDTGQAEGDSEEDGDEGMALSPKVPLDDMIELGEEECGE
ncbi:DUF2511 domain-containing protein [Spiractinospora alimapuensis]|uniref:DUF2511 domain-containing protein n=1 Tax=Spiractinospora alimapuensis TaxID=2820884 RepID=UPI001F3CCCDC|nr:DUF2511 domain-containing protein [Spiractinospora alimapuensis]QVQ50434.1 DUF2511 domain-containing protein [Spiractinospora alimapuensis]